MTSRDPHTVSPNGDVLSALPDELLLEHCAPIRFAARHMLPGRYGASLLRTVA